MSASGMDRKLPRCPRCGGAKVWRNGSSSSGKQLYCCQHCGRAFVLNPYIDGTIRELVDRMLAEDLRVEIIARVMIGRVSKRWIYKRKKELKGAHPGVC